ncbi:hypothetical protein [Enterococcus sp. C76]
MGKVGSKRKKKNRKAKEARIANNTPSRKDLRKESKIGEFKNR